MILLLETLADGVERRDEDDRRCDHPEQRHQAAAVARPPVEEQPGPEDRRRAGEERGAQRPG